MFESLKDKLQDVFSGLAKRGALSEADVDAALREVRLALLDADVAIPVVKSFITKVRDDALVPALKSVRQTSRYQAGHDALTDVLGVMRRAGYCYKSANGDFNGRLQFRNTTASKLASACVRERKKVMLASLDVTRPAHGKAALVGRTGGGWPCRS